MATILVLEPVLYGQECGGPTVCLHVDEFYYYLVYVACAALGGVGQ